MHVCCLWRRMVLEGPLFGEYFRKVEVSNFEVASDAFQTFKDLLTRHKGLVAAYLQSHYDEVRHWLTGSRMTAFMRNGALPALPVAMDSSQVVCAHDAGLMC